MRFNRFSKNIYDPIDITYMRNAYEAYMREQTEQYWRDQIAKENNSSKD
jgi:hypothetical protein